MEKKIFLKHNREGMEITFKGGNPWFAGIWIENNGWEFYAITLGKRGKITLKKQK